MTTTQQAAGVGALLREWRTRRGRTQMDVALDAGISAKHLSFVETGRSRPSAEMVLRLAEQLEVPFRERNQLLMAAGHAPAFEERGLTDPELAPVREALSLILEGHEPYPAVVVDRHWNSVAINRPMAAIGRWVDDELLEPPVNIMRAGLHPKGLARWIVNIDEVKSHFIGRLRKQLAITGDGDVAELLSEIESYGAVADGRDAAKETSPHHILTPLMQMRGPEGTELSFFATVATFGTAAEVTTSELSIELAFPADEATAKVLTSLPRR